MKGSLPRQSKDVVARRVAGETFLVPVRGRLADLKGLYALNSVGSFIWERIDGNTDVPGLADAVAGEFEVAADKAEEDVAEMVSVLRGHGFVEDGQ